MTPLLLAVLGGWFGDEPIADQVEIGKRIAGKFDQDQWERQLNIPPTSAKRTDIVEILGDDRKAIGQWSEGVRKLDVEWVVRLSPELMSRWFGYLSLREAWPEGELERRWGSVRQELGNKPVYILVLSAFPKKELFGLGETVSPTTDEMTNVRIVFEQGGRNIETMSYEIWDQRAETRSELDSVPWWQFTRLKPELTSMFETGYEPPIVQRGDYYRNWRWVVPTTDLAEGDVILKVLSKRKVRFAKFTSSVASSDTSKG